MAVTAASPDRMLGGRVHLRQMTHGFRSGLEAVILAASVPAISGESALELGSGAGAASLCLAARVPGCRITGTEIDRQLVALANENAESNTFPWVEFVETDVMNLPPALRREFDHVFCNPPFHGNDGERSPDPGRARATHDAALADWLMVGMKRTASGGTLTTIFRGDRLHEALSTISGEGVSIFPLWPRSGEPAKRIILQLRKGSSAPLRLLPGLVLHEADGSYAREADAILRDGAALRL